MKLLNIIKNWFKTSPTQVEVEEIEEAPQVSCSDLFVEICAEHGIGKTLLERIEAIEKFEKWYDGECDIEAIRSAISEFKKTDITIIAKITSYSKGKL